MFIFRKLITLNDTTCANNKCTALVKVGDEVSLIDDLPFVAEVSQYYII